MIISVDHGNKAIKTPHFHFTSGLVVSDSKPGFNTDWLCWDGKYYTLTEQRIAYLRDKTEDLRFYALTLFAIARELQYSNVPETVDPIDVTLLVGLPPHTTTSSTAVSSSTFCESAMSWTSNSTATITPSGSTRC